MRIMQARIGVGGLKLRSERYLIFALQLFVKPPEQILGRRSARRRVSGSAPRRRSASHARNVAHLGRNAVCGVFKRCFVVAVISHIVEGAALHAV